MTTEEPAQSTALEDAAREAWLYFYPLLLMQLTREAEQDLEMNAWAHAEAFRSHDFKAVIRPYCPTEPIVYGGDGWHLEPVR